MIQFTLKKNREACRLARTEIKKTERGEIKMILSHEDIVESVASGLVRIDPKPVHIGPDSIDLSLSGRFFRISPPPEGVLDIKNYTLVEDQQTRVILYPREVLNAFVLERVSLPNNLAGMVTATSRAARVGLGVATAVLVHAGWEGYLNLELVNLGQFPTCLYKGLVICQLALIPLSSPTSYTYGSQGTEFFHNQGGN